MKRILLLLSIFLMGAGAVSAQKQMKTTYATVKLIPDSIVIAGKDTSYLIITGGNGFLTKNHSLYRQIIDHMTSDTVRNDGVDNIVLLEGAYIGALSKFYKSQFSKNDIDKGRALELNGYLYRITGYKLDFSLSGQFFKKDETTNPVNPATNTNTTTQNPTTTTTQTQTSEQKPTTSEPKKTTVPKVTLQQAKENRKG